MVLLDVATGLRQSELFALKWKDVDFKNKQLWVIRSIVQQVVGNCKTEASQKPVPLHDHLTRDLRNWRRRTPYRAPEAGCSPALRIVERARIGDNSFFVITSARSRKDWASRSGLGGTPFAATIRVTLDTYTQAVTSEKRAAQTAVVALFIRKKRSKAA